MEPCLLRNVKGWGEGGVQDLLRINLHKEGGYFLRCLI